MKRVVLTVTLLVLIIAFTTAGYLSYNSHTSQSDVTLERSEGCIGTFPIMNCLITPYGMMSFLVDTGCDLSMITPETLRAIEEAGYSVDSSFCPVVFRTPKGAYHFTTTRYTVDLPIDNWEVEISGDGTVYYNRDSIVDNVIHGVNFVPSVRDIDVLGLDFLRKFDVEMRLSLSVINLYDGHPEGYEPLIQMERGWSLPRLVGADSRFYIPMQVAGVKNDFFVDSSLDLVHVKMPQRDTVNTRSPLTDRSVLTPLGNIRRARESRGEWASFGSRAGSVNVCYYSDGVNEYAVNPFRFLSQDVLLDFGDNQLCVRPQYDLIKTND